VVEVVRLEEILRGVDLPSHWGIPDPHFSKDLTLWDFQVEAVINGLKALNLFYYVLRGNRDFLASIYGVNPRVEPSRKVREALEEVLPRQVYFRDLVNRACFWMATGSGKTLVALRLAKEIGRLMQANLIPKGGILILTSKDYVIEKLRKYGNKMGLEMVDLNRFSDLERVYVYRSDLIGLERKEKILDFREFSGDWYLILDEAHKGDKSDSLRQWIFWALSRTRFSMHFSASFVEEIDMITTAYTFNLSSFVRRGYGKHITIIDRSLKEIGMLKPLILTSYLRKVVKSVPPLLLALVNTVNFTSKGFPDLLSFLSYVIQVARGGVSEFEKAREQLSREVSGELLFEDRQLNLDLSGFTFPEFMYGLFGVSTPFHPTVTLHADGIVSISNGESPFCIVRIGNGRKWVRDTFPNHVISEDSGLFRSVDSLDRVSILVGSRAFYEGWDSPRPHVMVFVNLGLSESSRKFVVQAVGRGVRVEHKGRKGRAELWGHYSDPREETLYVFGTDPLTLTVVLQTLRAEDSPLNVSPTVPSVELTEGDLGKLKEMLSADRRVIWALLGDNPPNLHEILRGVRVRPGGPEADLETIISVLRIGSFSSTLK
jgi:hypothetical protein